METPSVKSKAQQLLEELLVIHQGKEDEVPEGFFPSRHYSKEWKISIAKTNELLSVAVKAGKVKKIMLRKLFNGKIRVIPFYG